ncbi:uncharacterized protein LOC123899666 isoform X1 [Trifolium pratense]|uniref:uncharacterized protein LOC123899666 isoform X1 n=1 Tax=Trifolium pratense TaxID=57577 RepID=UPI001E696C4B|nr:uncharacterized protein LOC123899666 isoform X1 [Trifolium pratense]
MVRAMLSFNILLQLLIELLPENSCLPSTFQDFKFIIKYLDISYEKINVCPNDCILYRKEFENKNTYHKCGASRYKEREVPKSKRKVSCKAMKKRMSDLAQSLGMPPGFGDGLK